MFACCLRSLSISLHDDHPQSRAHCFCLPVFVYLPDCLSLLPVLPHLYSAYALVSLFKFSVSLLLEWANGMANGAQQMEIFIYAR